MSDYMPRIGVRLRRGPRVMRCSTHGEVGFVRTESGHLMCARCHEEMLARTRAPTTLEQEIEAFKHRHSGGAGAGIEQRRVR